jgi:hypothetical protein
MFCGECGRSVTAAQPPPLVRPTVPAVPPREEARPEREREREPEPELAAEREPEPHEELEPDSPTFLEESLERCFRCGTLAEPEDLYCAECGTVLASRTRAIEPLSSTPPEPAALAEPAPALAPEHAPEPEPEPEPHEDTEATRMVPRTAEGHRFVLQFSTGESVTVTGSGLAGRHPRAEPGEFVDHLVTILDPGRSVSKTHFEFGHEQGFFWFSDRHSGNGSVIREPGAAPRLCEPGRRYRIVRGTRIDIGEQFVVVS